MAAGGGEEAGGQTGETRRQDCEANGQESSGARAKGQDTRRRQRKHISFGACLVWQVCAESSAATTRGLRMSRCGALWVLALALAMPVRAVDLPQQRIVPGGVATIDLGP